MSESPKTPESSSNTTSKTSARKLKQARLPFHVISPETSKPITKKRKLNNDGDDNEILLKISKNEENENKSTNKLQNENIQDVEMIELDDENENETNIREKDKKGKNNSGNERKNDGEKDMEGKNNGEKDMEGKNNGEKDIEGNTDNREKNNEEEMDKKSDKIKLDDVNKLDDSLNDEESENDEDLSLEKLDTSCSDESSETKTKEQKKLKKTSENNHDQSLIDSSNDESTERKAKKQKKLPKIPLDNNDISINDLSPDESSASDNKTPSKSLTPKQIKKQVESAKKKEEREKIRLEKEKERLERKEEKEKLRLEKEKEKEKIKIQKEMKRIEKEEKEKKKQEIIDAKNEEKKLKEEERRKKEERKQAAAAAFTSFFVPKNKSSEETKSPDDNTTTPFMPFQIKTDMRLAPKTRIEFKEEVKESFDNVFRKQNVELSDLYLNHLKDKKYIKRKSSKTWPLSELNKEIPLDEQNEIYLIPTHEEEGLVQHLQLSHTEKPPKAKLLLFHENQRPPYWGTWRKPMKSVTPKKPFAKEDILDYNVDSELEWEDEEPGESLQGSEDDRESEDEYEVDNEFFVPHGYLSDGENENEEEDNVETTENKETCKEERLHKMEIDFEEEMKRKTTRIQPTVIGCIWREDFKHQKFSTQLKTMIMSRCALYDKTLPIDVIPIEINPSLSNSPTQSPSSDKKYREFDDEDIKNLILLVQGNPNSRQFLAQEFAKFLTNENEKVVSRRQIFIKIKEIAEWKMNNSDGKFKGRLCWMVKPDILKSHNFNEQINDLSWNYTLKPKITQEPLVELNLEPAIINAPKDNIPLITKFTKVLTKEEKEKQVSSKKENISTNQNSDCDIILVKENITNGSETSDVVDEKDKINNKSTSTTSSSKLTPKLTDYLFKSAKK